MREAARCHGAESSRCERKDGRAARREPEPSDPRCWGFFKKADLTQSCWGDLTTEASLAAPPSHPEGVWPIYAEFSQSCLLPKDRASHQIFNAPHGQKHSRLPSCRSSCTKPSEPQIHHPIASKCYRSRTMLSQIRQHVSP